jgi:hypothetical protein
MKNKIILGAVLILTFAIGCKKEGRPTRDTIKPKMQLTLSGGGLNKTFYSDSNYVNGQLNLKPNVKYNFVITASDTSGINQLYFWMQSVINFGTVNSIPAHTSTIGLAESIYRIYQPDASNANISFLMYGDFTTSNVGFNENVAFILNLQSFDWGNNQADLKISSLISQTPTLGFGWVEI